ncbi:DMT family transporter [Clostridium sediminicola]|uniref:DMT family transporter n=1 Tax=Clostridium sediminicola TaxID=3114879 RepID=UPI0031F26291
MEKIAKANKKNYIKLLIEKNSMVIAALFWAGAFIAGKFSVEEFPIFTLIFLRFFIGTIVIASLLLKNEGNWKIEKKDLKLLVAMSLTGMVGYHLFFFMSLKFTSPVNSALIGATNPCITTLLSAFFLKDKINSKNILAILLAFTGVVLITINGDFAKLISMKFNKGDLLMMLAVLFWVVYAILSKKAGEKYSPLKITSYVFSICAIVTMPLMISEKPWEIIGNTTIKGWGSIIYMAIFASVIGYLIQQISIKKIGPSKTSLYINLVPLFSMILAFFILGQKITLISVLAATFIISGVFINSR